MDGPIQIKTKEEIEIMHEAGKKLARVKKALKDAIKVGVSAAEIEDMATKLIEEEGAKPSFKMVEDYQWSTCVNINDGVVHGIPKKEMVFTDNDLVSVDVGLYYKGFHSDTSVSKYLGKNPNIKKFLKAGREALDKAISQAKVGNKIEDISREMEEGVKKVGATTLRSLVGHGIGRQLHEAPMVPCYVSHNHHESVELVEGMVVAIEIMYTQGKPGIKLDRDGWTLSTRDGKISALFEETVAILADGPLVLTK